MHDALDPGIELAIEITERAERARGEEGESALGAADSTLAEGAPVDLGFLAGQLAEPKKRLARGHGPDVAHVAPERKHATDVAAVTDHLEQTRRAEPGVLLERCPYEV